MSDLLVIALLSYAALSFIIMLFGAVEGWPAYYIILWPIVVVKYLLKSLYFELFNGWKP